MDKGVLPHGSVLGNIFRLLRGINIHPAYIAIPLTLSLAAAASEGVSLSLLIPMLNGFLTRDYSFILTLPGLSSVLGLLPLWVTANDRSLFMILMALFVLCVLTKNVLRYSAAISMGYFASRALHHLRKVMFERFLSFGKLYFDRTSVGHNSTVLLQFSELVLLPLQSINDFVNATCSILVYLVIMSLISWKLTAFALPLFIVLHFSVRIAISRIRQYSKSIAAQGSSLGKMTVEILSTIPLVKSYSSERREQSRYAAISDAKARLIFHSLRLKELVLPLQETITLFSILLLFSAMLYLLVSEHSATATSFIVYFYLVLNAANKFGTLTNFRGVLANAEGPVDELMKIFSDGDKAFVPDGTDEFPGLRQSVEFRQLSFSYPGRKGVLRDISFTIPHGRMVAIVGPTGGGKTTLINLIMRLYDVPPHSLFIDSRDIREFTLASLHQHIALVSQETLLLNASFRQNIAYGLDAVPHGRLEQVVAQARLSDTVSRLPQGLDTLIGDRGVKLSGGEKQRVSIARALLKGAGILILDEATSALDSHTEKLIQEAIDEAVRGRTAIVIAHRLSTIRHADKIVVVEEGRVREEGTLQELLDCRGHFFRLWEEQKFV